MEPSYIYRYVCVGPIFRVRALLTVELSLVERIPRHCLQRYRSHNVVAAESMLVPEG